MKKIKCHDQVQTLSITNEKVVRMKKIKKDIQSEVSCQRQRAIKIYWTNNGQYIGKNVIVYKYSCKDDA